MTKALALALMLCGCRHNPALVEALRSHKPIVTTVTTQEWIQKLTEAQQQEAALMEALRTSQPIK